MYWFLPGHPSCDDVENTRAILGKWDVSEIEGVVCEGDGCWTNHPEDIDRLEFNVDFGHFSEFATTNKPRTLTLPELQPLSQCRPTRDNDFICSWPYPSNGMSILFCETDVFPLNGVVAPNVRGTKSTSEQSG
ncbi:hypothetical protein QBC36DRAFT_244629 [Triangularia setosa]|uniref:Uncharacterized protein n=1 Tax=Triangularia setosa TaxID=2587417 RepID=A0AAN7A5C9_9PEZI|nr:hypothetical protein QBC36DRAFT_244629 [Podospora setosa]